MLWAPADQFPQKCRLCCSEDAEEAARVRAEWGCDVPSPTPQHDFDCLHCSGPDDPDPKCEACGGSGTQQVFECPRSLMTAETLDVCRAASLLEHGVLPEDGGWQDQSCTWGDAVMLALAQLRKWREVHMESARQKAEAEARRRHGG